MVVIVRAGLISEITWSAGWLIDDLLTFLENLQKFVRALKTCIKSVEKGVCSSWVKVSSIGGTLQCMEISFFS